jgi:rRNA maturation protein Nop10
MTRKRTTETVTDFLTDACPACGGRGKIPSPETVSLLAEREMLRVALNEKKPREALLVTCNPAVAEVLVGSDGENADRLEQQLRHAVFVRAVPDFAMEKYEVASGELADYERKYGAVKRGQVVDCRVVRSVLQPEPAVVGLADGLILALDDGKKHVGQCVKARIADVHRSYATAGVIPGSNRPLSAKDL